MKRKAFTLIELLVVIAIIGILVGIVFESVTKYRRSRPQQQWQPPVESQQQTNSQPWQAPVENTK